MLLVSHGAQFYDTCGSDQVGNAHNMSKRLNSDREERLQPKRIEYAKNQITRLGYTITAADDTELVFEFKGSPIKFFPYSGWHTGKTIIDGRGIDKLLKQITTA